MKLKNKMKTMVLATSLSLLLSNSVLAHDNSNGLISVMQGLLDDSLVLNQGILEKDFSKIEKASNDIANHPKPGMVTMKKVMVGLGSEMASFKGFDTLVHDIAMNIKEAATKEDMVTVKSSYHELLNGCLSCHTQYKTRVTNLLK
jgi:cytochrome c556